MGWNELANKIENDIIEDRIREKKIHRIGSAIMMMNYWQRLWWALTGRSEYMTNSYWDRKDTEQ